jgi:anaphase-promoting complex subunit 3
MLTITKASQQIKEAIESLEDEDDEDESSMMA